MFSGLVFVEAAQVAEFLPKTIRCGQQLLYFEKRTGR